MTTIDAQGNIHDQAGKFSEKANSEPSALPAGTDSTFRYSETEHLRQQALQAAAFADAADYALAQASLASIVHEVTRLHPEAVSASISRDWDGEEQLRLIGLYDADGQGIPLTNERDGALWLADLNLSNTDRIAELLDEVPSGEGWDEWTLDLTKKVRVKSAADLLADRASVEQRNDLYAALSDFDGRMAPAIDTGEIVYRITEGFISESEPERAARIIERFGTAEEAAARIADTPAWWHLRDVVEDLTSERANDALVEAIDEALAS